MAGRSDQSSIDPGASFQFGRTSILLPEHRTWPDHSTLEIGNLGIGWITPDFDEGLMSAGIIEARLSPRLSNSI